jgi:deoxycytidylate deaminase
MVGLARRIALTKAQHVYALHATIILKAGKPVATGHNHGWVHAEVDALEKIWPQDRKGLRVLNFRITRAGNIVASKPCPKCEEYLRENGIKCVWYSKSDGTFEKMKL